MNALYLFLFLSVSFLFFSKCVRILAPDRLDRMGTWERTTSAHAAAGPVIGQVLSDGCNCKMHCHYRDLTYALGHGSSIIGAARDALVTSTLR